MLINGSVPRRSALVGLAWPVRRTPRRLVEPRGIGYLGIGFCGRGRDQTMGKPCTAIVEWPSALCASILREKGKTSLKWRGTLFPVHDDDTQSLNRLSSPSDKASSLGSKMRTDSSLRPAFAGSMPWQRARRLHPFLAHST
jgi:hypothetical protein